MVVAAGAAVAMPAAGDMAAGVTAVAAMAAGGMVVTAAGDTVFRSLKAAPLPK
jgi:hypothetical protein